jgi:hypothetical protein
MLPTVGTKNLSRQDAKKNSFFFELGDPCAFARDAVFPISFSSKNSNIFG